MKALTKPSKVANALEWTKSSGGTVATLNVHADRIGVRISQHPTGTHRQSPSPPPSSSSYHSLPLRRKGLHKIPDSTRQRLADLVKEHNVCGFLVSWPIQGDTGLRGAPCGRTLYVMEELLQQPRDEPDDSSPTASLTLDQQPQQQQQQQHGRHQPQHRQKQQQQQQSLFVPSRPVCLWNGVHNDPPPAADTFGRSPVFARTSHRTEHRASKEQYHQDESIVTLDVWEDFVQCYWPEIFQQHQQQYHHRHRRHQQQQQQQLRHEQIRSKKIAARTNGHYEWDDDGCESSHEHQAIMVA